MTATTTAPAPRKTARRRSITLHRVTERDLMRGQVYGDPIFALCGEYFVPRSGDTETGTAGGADPVVCKACEAMHEHRQGGAR